MCCPCEEPVSSPQGPRLIASLFTCLVSVFFLRTEDVLSVESAEESHNRPLDLRSWVSHTLGFVVIHIDALCGI